MGLGVNAPTAAAHALMVIVLALTLFRMQRLSMMPRESLGLSATWLFPAPVSMMLFALIVERIYYFLARTLITTSDINLWGAHPAPEILSLIVAFSAMWITPAYLAVRGLDRRQRHLRCAAEATGAGIVWALLWWVLV